MCVQGNLWPTRSNPESSQEANGLYPPLPVMILNGICIAIHCLTPAKPVSLTIQFGIPLASSTHPGGPPWQIITNYMSVDIHIYIHVYILYIHVYVYIHMYLYISLYVYTHELMAGQGGSGNYMSHRQSY